MHENYPFDAIELGRSDGDGAPESAPWEATTEVVRYDAAAKGARVERVVSQFSCDGGTCADEFLLGDQSHHVDVRLDRDNLGNRVGVADLKEGDSLDATFVTAADVAELRDPVVTNIASASITASGGRILVTELDEWTSGIGGNLHALGRIAAILPRCPWDSSCYLLRADDGALAVVEARDDSGVKPGACVEVVAPVAFTVDDSDVAPDSLPGVSLTPWREGSLAGTWVRSW